MATILDTNDFLNKLLTIGKLPSNSLLVTLDVSSLYTYIPHNEGINACDYFLRTDPHNTISTIIIIIILIIIIIIIIIIIYSFIVRFLTC